MHLLCTVQAWIQDPIAISELRADFSISASCMEVHVRCFSGLSTEKHRTCTSMAPKVTSLLNVTFLTYYILPLSVRHWSSRPNKTLDMTVLEL